MTDYIKREDAIQKFAGVTLIECDKTTAESPYSLSAAEKFFADIPSADVVEADKAQKEIDYWHDKAQSYEQTILKLSLNKADVVEVVRCKDCKYMLQYEQIKACCKVNNFLQEPKCVSDNDFCSRGERKNETH